MRIATLTLCTAALCLVASGPALADRRHDGTATIQQPLILPFYGGKSHHEVLAALLGDPDATAYEVVRGFWQGRVSGDFESFWRQSVYRGVVSGTASAPVAVPGIGSAAVGTWERDWVTL